MTVFRWFLLLLFFGSAYALAVSPPSLFEQAWEDFIMFEQDLVSSYQGLSAELSDLSIYHLDLDLNDDLASLNGKLEVLFSNTTGEILNDLVFRLYPNVLGSRLSVKRVELDGVLSVGRLERAETVFRVFLPQALAPGEKLVISMQFVTQIGQGRESYGRLALYNESLSLAHAYPVLSVFHEGGWLLDTPSPMGDPGVLDAAYYLVRVKAPRDQTLIASGTMLERKESLLGQTVVFATGPVREFFLASVKDYVQLSKSVGETLIHVYLPQRFDHAAEASLDYAAHALERFSRLKPYPYRELDIVAMPILASGIEFPGVFSLTNRLFANPAGSLESVLVHETAHQWSYNLVGSDQVLEPWLDEALAQYLTLLYHRSYSSDDTVESYLQFWDATWHEAANPLDKIGHPVSHYEGFSYSSIVYGRGLFFFLALEDVMGAEALEDALSQYYQSNSWQFVTVADLKLQLEAACACTLTELFSEWIGLEY